MVNSFRSEGVSGSVCEWSLKRRWRRDGKYEGGCCASRERRIENKWTRWENGTGVSEIVARMASRSLRRARRRVDSSVVGDEGAGGEIGGLDFGGPAGAPFGGITGGVGDFGEVEDGGGAGLRGRDVGGFLAGSLEELTGRDEKAASRSLECIAQNCMYRATILL